MVKLQNLGEAEMMRLVLVATALSLSAVSMAAAAPAGPALLVIHHKVADYAKWRPGYDAHKPVRTAAGLTNCRVRSSVDDPNDVFIACEMADVAKAKAFTTSPSLAKAMKGAGVVGKPDFEFLGAERLR
jgi:hypothetical protein